MFRHILALQVFLLMCAPLPQASYVAVGIGRESGLAMALILMLYLLSDIVVAGAITVGVRRLPLPSAVRRLIDRAATRAERAARGRATLGALFVVGFASLYSAAVLAGLGQRRIAPALAAGIAGDLVQFTGTVLLGGALARLAPVPGGEWTVLLATPLLLAAAPALVIAARRARGVLLGPTTSVRHPSARRHRSVCCREA